MTCGRQTMLINLGVAKQVMIEFAFRPSQTPHPSQSAANTSHTPCNRIVPCTPAPKICDGRWVCVARERGGGNQWWRWSVVAAGVNSVPQDRYGGQVVSDAGVVLHVVEPPRHIQVLLLLVHSQVHLREGEIHLNHFHCFFYCNTLLWQHYMNGHANEATLN